MYSHQSIQHGTFGANLSKSKMVAKAQKNEITHFLQWKHMNLNIIRSLPPNNHISFGFDNCGVLNTWKAII